jgi:hypothetical protein
MIEQTVLYDLTAFLPSINRYIVVKKRRRELSALALVNSQSLSFPKILYSNHYLAFRWQKKVENKPG